MDSNIINHEESYLLNKLHDYPVTKGEGKFDNDGNPLHWPGCTIICPIQESSLVSSLLSEVQENFKEIAPKKKYTFLPQSSFHMTLFDCCNVSTFKTSFWPNNLQKTENYLEVANILSDRLKNYQFPSPLTVKLNKFFGGFSTLLTPYSAKDEETLRSCRDDLSNLLGIKFENHLRYTRPDAFEPIGISCRLCERRSCHQRSVPPLERQLIIDENERAMLPYRVR